MPTISIRQHGVSASRNQTVVNPVTGEIVKLTAFNQPERTATRGWTPNVARRNEQRLQQIDFDAVDGFPAFVTLTMPSGQMGDVSAADFHGWLKRWLQFMKRHGLQHYYWILEFQASGNPHLHVLVWLDHDWDALEQFKALRSWVNMLNKSGVGARLQGQIWESIDVGGVITVDGKPVPAHPERVLMYLAKHAARGVAHYQRQIENMPEDWKYRSGRVWGHDRGLPLCAQQDVETDYPTFHRFRRLVRRWRLAEARGIKDADRRRQAIVQARRSLRCGRRDVSPYRGVSAWIPSDVASALLDAAEAMGGDYEED
ncbi:rolling circle replication-associated protein [Bifidobacterium catenulatum]|uniref:rolling circle replication-associated protein n=1 Tax=Bifidobacterium catenulatum TaxID=1686 RepID=UPI000507CB54|nr:hypothetical protein [Bifidobacterium catenulatum]KFI63795.1 putative replication protein [Bifidobacterium catenulatum subsp. kashiwanohense JCM 15439 = DSM 21854]MDH7870337.1 hypothetical protein [Bifidobacterium catenulatum subsp. kashiwanohense]